MEFALGSAGWRSKYGFFGENLLGVEQIEVISDEARLKGFNWIDTAPTYGDVEDFIGQAQTQQKIATKVTVNINDLNSILKSIESSLLKLNLRTIDLLFVHNWDLFDRDRKNTIVRKLESFKEIGLISQWGFCTYESDEILKITETNWTNFCIQINTNILDQRILKVSKMFKAQELDARGIELWARSIFLQGILVDFSSSNRFINHPDVIKFINFANQNKISPMVLCLFYVKQIKLFDVVVVGIKNLNQLNQLALVKNEKDENFELSHLASSDISLIDPRVWA